ncbi:MAG: hypothetical protein WDW38_002111 [Sanguina aurantia]
MDAFLSSAGAAVQHVTRLELTVRRQDTDEPEQRPSRAASSLLPPSSSSNSLFQVPRTVLSTLAAAVPRLELLKVKAVYGDVDLAEFGKHCPKLAELIMESEAIALQGIDLAVPGLTTLVLILPNVPWFLQELDRERAFVETACLLLRGCTKLSVVHIRFRSLMNSHHELECGKGVWEQLPPSLEAWHCNASFSHMWDATSFLGRVRALTLATLPCHSLPEFLERAQSLDSLTLTSLSHDEEGVVEMMWRDDVITPHTLARLKARLLDGFQLCCESVLFSGSDASVRDMLGWLSPLRDTHHCCVDLDAMEHGPGCFAEFARAVPDVRYLRMGLRTGWEEPPWMDESFLTPLVKCSKLQRLDVCLGVAFTHAGLVALCTSLPDLLRMYCWPVQGVCFDSVKAELAAKGRQLTFSYIMEGEDVIEPFED